MKLMQAVSPTVGINTLIDEKDFKNKEEIGLNVVFEHE